MSDARINSKVDNTIGLFFKDTIKEQKTELQNAVSEAIQSYILKYRSKKT